MSTSAIALPAARWTARAGAAVSGLAIVFLLLDAVSHLLVPPPVVEAFGRLGFPARLATPLGILELACLAAYAWPRSAPLGAILLTGYLGGAISINLRVGDPAFETLFPALIGILVWGGLYLREGRLQALLPLRRGR